MSTHYNRPSPEPIVREDHDTGLTIKIKKYQASFYIGIYKGRYKIASVYKSPYQRKYEDYKCLSNEIKRQEFSHYEFVIFEMIEAEEKLLMHEYEEAFKECLTKYPKPSYPVTNL